MFEFIQFPIASATIPLKNGYCFNFLHFAFVHAREGRFRVLEERFLEVETRQKNFQIFRPFTVSSNSIVVRNEDLVVETKRKKFSKYFSRFEQPQVGFWAVTRSPTAVVQSNL